MKNIDLIFRTYYRPLCLYALHYLGNLEAAEDTVQDCFVKLLQHDAQNQKAFLYAAVRNACIDALRKKNPIDARVSPTDIEGTMADDEAQERSLHEAELWTAVDSLPERCRQVLILCKRDGLSYKETAEKLGISVKTVEHQMSKALKVLRGKESQYLYIFL